MISTFFHSNVDIVEVMDSHMLNRGGGGARLGLSTSGGARMRLLASGDARWGCRRAVVAQGWGCPMGIPGLPRRRQRHLRQPPL